MDDGNEPSVMLGRPAFGFAEPGPLRDELTARVLDGTKVATSSLVVDYVVDGDALPVVGEQSVVYDSARRPVAIVETTAWRLATIGTVDDEFARGEGEGYADAAAWRVSHERFWNGYLADYRRDLRDPDFVLTTSTPVVCEWFRLVARVDPATETVVAIPPTDLLTERPRRPTMTSIPFTLRGAIMQPRPGPFSPRQPR